MTAITFHVNIGGRRLRVQKITVSSSADQQDSPTLVFLHEGLGSIEQWKDFPKMLCRATGINGLVYDRKGYGGSDAHDMWPKDYLIEEANVDLPGLIKSCRIGNVILIGHSDGGSIALLAAATHKRLVKGAITEAAHIFVENETVNGIRKFMRLYDIDDKLKKKLSRYHGENTDNVVRRWADTWLAPDFRDWNIESFLPRISCPLLVLQGANDEYATLRQVRGIVDQVTGPVSWKIISQCGHVPHFQAPGQVMALMSSFILSIVQEEKNNPCQLKS
jgi:pimeloyl-ACP methyl ester carboxylesterase